MSCTVSDVIAFLEEVAPPQLSEDWDNVGLLIGEQSQATSSIMTCLTLTPDVAEEAVREDAGLIVTHHPVLFRAVKRLTGETREGEVLLSLIQQSIAIYSPHTSYDSAPAGINQQLAELIGLTDTAPLRPVEGETGQGSGRFGNLSQPISLSSLIANVKDKLGLTDIQFVGEPGLLVSRMAIACGAAAEYLVDAKEAGCQVLLTGEARFHDCLSARSEGLGMILPGHYMTERPAMEALAVRLARQFPKLRVWASHAERDPVHYA